MIIHWKHEGSKVQIIIRNTITSNVQIILWKAKILFIIIILMDEMVFSKDLTCIVYII